ncbi:MAG: hypothetical protein RLZZ574_2642 [Cyanobacteriota bacterium]|jgi:hypothetical protein
MINLLKRRWLIVVSAGIVGFLFHLFWLAPVFSTAPSPPQLTKIDINGKTKNILFITRSDDTVLVRCYPSLVPNLTIGQKQPNVSTTGYLKCQPEDLSSNESDR